MKRDENADFLKKGDTKAPIIIVERSKNELLEE